MIEVLADQFCFLSGFMEGSIIEYEKLLPFIRSCRTHKLGNKPLRQDSKELVPVD